MNVTEIPCEDIIWILLVEGRVRFGEASVNIVMNIRVT
jgi:hypothetical protein